jgi:hypothetical protein
MEEGRFRVIPDLFSEIKKLENPEYLRKLRCMLMATIFHVDAIESEEDREVILVHIECLEELERDFPKLIPLKEAIRIGQGDFKKIQDKCIRLGVV